MGKMKKPKQGEEDDERKGKKKRYSQIKPSAKTTMQTRKEMRKQQRKAKKAKKFEFYSKKSKLNTPQQAVVSKKDTGKASGKNKKQGQSPKQPKQPQPQHQAKAKKVKSTSEKMVDSHEQLKLEEQQLRKEMDAVRRKRLLEENLQEDKTIRKAEKILKINKKSKIPASFREDGLDYILELVSSSGKSKKKDQINKPGESDDGDDGSEEDYDGMSDDEDDEDLSDEEETSTVPKKRLKQNLESEDDMESDSGEESDADNADSIEVDDDDNESDSGSEEDSFGSGEELDSNEEHDELLESIEDAEKHVKKKPKKSKDNEYWEDIYGRLRNKEGAVINEKTMQPINAPVAATGGKYVPPAKRGEESGRAKIMRNLKGLLNRLSEGNMHNVSQQVEELYMSNSRNEMNESLLELLYASLLSDVIMPERLVWEHVMLVTILHANVGSEVGAFFVQNFIQKFRELYDQFDNLEESKRVQNAVLLIAATYHFKIVGCKLIFDVLEFMAKNFTPKDIELILTLLKSVGFRLRKDDPIMLKNLILVIQEHAGTADASNSRVRFMVDVLMAIKNNNMTKIPNYDPSHGEHLIKIIRQHFHKGNYVTELKIGMADLLNAESKGRWWIVGSAWSNLDSAQQSTDATSSSANTTISTVVNKKLLAKAKKFGMNTDVRRSIFCVIMTAEDYLEAFEKLMHLGLKNQQAREMIHVLVYCCLHEKKYNPYYALILNKLCATERHFMLTLQYGLWDRLKDMTSLAPQQLDNMSRLLVDLITEKTLPLSVLKIIDFGDMKKEKLVFLKSTLGGILLQKNKENLEEIVFKIGLSEKLHLFRESLKLFLGHFMLKESIEVDGEEVTSTLDATSMKLLEDRIKIVENALQVGRGRLLL